MYSIDIKLEQWMRQSVESMNDDQWTRAIGNAYSKLTALCTSDSAVASLPKSAATIFLLLIPVNTSDNIVGGKAGRGSFPWKLRLDIWHTVNTTHRGWNLVDNIRGNKIIAPVTRRFYNITLHGHWRMIDRRKEAGDHNPSSPPPLRRFANC